MYIFQTSISLPCHAYNTIINFLYCKCSLVEYVDNKFNDVIIFPLHSLLQLTEVSTIAIVLTVPKTCMLYSMTEWSLEYALTINKREALNVSSHDHTY